MSRKLEGEDDEMTAKGIHLSFLTGFIFFALWAALLVHSGEKNGKCYTNTETRKIECNIGR